MGNFWQYEVSMQEDHAAAPAVPERHWLEATVEFLSSALLMVAIVLVIRFFVIQPFRVDGESMSPTFENKEYILVDKLSYRLRNPVRGEVVIFNPQVSDPALSYIKRVIGLPGDRIVIQNGQVMVYNDQHSAGWVLPEPYVHGQGTFLSSDAARKLDVTLGPDEYFLMGDNRPHSFDSRNLGAVSRSQLVGRADYIVLPVSAASHVDTAKY